VQCSYFGSVPLAGVGNFEAEGQEVGGVVKDVAVAVVRPGGDDCLPLGRPVLGRADGFGEQGLAWRFHYVADQVKSFREAKNELFRQFTEESRVSHGLFQSIIAHKQLWCNSQMK
jgi:hypothetical protein